MFRTIFRPLFFVVLFVAVFSHAGDWRFSAGAGLRNQTPVVLIGGVGYNNLMVYLQGMGMSKGENHFWCGYRGSLLWTFFKELPFHFDTGLGLGYEYAEAPNKLHQEINKANEGRYTFPYNYKETADLSLELWAHLYGLYTQISVPMKKFAEHDAHKIFWGAGYIYEF